MYHDFYLLHEPLKNKSFKLKLINQKNFELKFIQKGSVQRIKSSLFEKKERLHDINDESLVTKKDYLNDYFLFNFYW